MTAVPGEAGGGAGLSAEERGALHEFHASTINPDWRTCPLCPPLASAVKAVLAARLTAAEARATALAAQVAAVEALVWKYRDRTVPVATVADELAALA